VPELPDLTLYIEALQQRIQQQSLRGVVISSPFLLRTVAPAPEQFSDHTVTSIRRLGKRICLGFDNDGWMVLHLMIAGRFQWRDAGAKARAGKALASFEFDCGTLILTEAGSKRRASLHCFDSESAMLSQDRGGIEVFDSSLAQFSERLQLRNHTLKRALADPTLFSGIGNAYSDEILHHAQLSPVRQTQKMQREEIATLFHSCQHVLSHWVEQLKSHYGDSFPVKVTAFRDGMAVHGRYRQPCPVCETLVQRIRFASNETNYCPRCQTGGKLLADRSLSKLLKKDWPKNIDELEEQQASAGQSSGRHN
jgi:formamidopyrimidine-DNA glycosylase